MGDAWNHVDDRCLGQDDFQDVRREVPELAGVWQGLATGLGLSPAHVREIDLANRGDPSRCLDGVIEKWLNQDYNYNKFGEPSWKKLVAAVADSSGGKNTALARKIGQKHPHQFPTSSPVIPNSGIPIKAGKPVGMRNLVNDLSKVAHKWHALGLQLGVDSHDLDRIRGAENDAKTCLTSMLTYWLDNNTDAHRSQIVEMLTSAAINEQSLARKLKNSRDIPDGRLKSDQDLVTLVNFLDPVASKWEDIGIQLDISSRQLDNLKKSGGNVDQALKEVLKKVESSYPTTTVKQLCLALSSPPVGEKVLGENLEKKYTGNVTLFEE